MCVQTAMTLVRSQEGEPVQSEMAFDPFALMDEQPESRDLDRGLLGAEPKPIIRVYHIYSWYEDRSFQQEWTVDVCIFGEGGFQDMKMLTTKPELVKHVQERLNRWGKYDWKRMKRHVNFHDWLIDSLYNDLFVGWLDDGFVFDIQKKQICWMQPFSFHGLVKVNVRVVHLSVDPSGN